MYPRSTPGTWSRIVWQVGPSDAIPVIFRKSGTVSINEPLEARRRIMNPSRSPHRTDNTQKTSSSQKWGNFYKILAVLPMESTEVEGSFSFIRKILTWLPILTYDHRTTLRFGLHRHYANAVTTDRSVVCEKFVALHPRRMKASLLLHEASISSILWRFKTMQCYSLQFVFS